MPAQNPFFYGSPVDGERFTDREEQRSALAACMRNRQNAILLAPRRFGKTSLLGVAAAEARDAGVRVGLARLMGCSTREQVAQRIAAAISSEAMGWLPGHLEQLRRGLAAIRPGAELTLTNDGFRISMSVGRSHDGEWAEVVTALVRTLARMSQGDRPVSLILDEFQRVAEINEGFPGVFKDLVDTLPDLSLIFAGSKAHLMEMLTSGPGAPLLGVGQRITLGPVPEDRMIPFVVERTAAGGKTIAPAVAQRLYRLAHRVPNTVQQLAFWAFEHPGRQVSDASVTAALDRVVDLQEQEFVDRFERLSRLQQRVLLVLVDRGGGEPYWGVFSRSVLEELETTTNGVRTALLALRADELVIEHRRPGTRGGGWQVLDSFFAHWIGRLLR